MTPFAFGIWDFSVIAIGGALGAALAYLALRNRKRKRRKRRPKGLGTVQERRQQNRQAVDEVRVLVSVAKQTDSPVQAQVLDRSKGGVRLRVEKVFAAGTLLNLRPIKGSGKGSTKSSLQVRVKNCLRAGVQWEVGCEFLYPPSAAQLKFLG